MFVRTRGRHMVCVPNPYSPHVLTGGPPSSLTKSPSVRLRLIRPGPGTFGPLTLVTKSFTPKGSTRVRESPNRSQSDLALILPMNENFSNS